jgi:hypothetical protein
VIDVVYLVRSGQRNEELRYSLRSVAANLPHRRVFVVGDLPPWVTNVEFIPGNGYATKELNVPDNIRLACEHPDVSDDFIVLNDDFFVLRPIDRVPSLYRSTLAEHLRLLGRRQDSWQRSISATAAWLAEHGHSNPLSYELHVPIVVNKRKMLDALDAVSGYNHPTPPQWRTIYGNIHHVEAARAPDCKVRSRSDITALLDATFLSSSDETFRCVRRALTLRFPTPSPFETEPPGPEMVDFVNLLNGRRRTVVVGTPRHRRYQASPDWAPADRAQPCPTCGHLMEVDDGRS